MKKSDALLIRNILYQDEQMSDFNFIQKMRRIEDGLMMITKRRRKRKSESNSDRQLYFAAV
jgi:hypothetical protein